MELKDITLKMRTVRLDEEGIHYMELKVLLQPPHQLLHSMNPLHGVESTKPGGVVAVVVTVASESITWS